MDVATALRWHQEKVGHDWSAQDSGATMEDVRPEAIAIARRHLMHSPNASDNELGESIRDVDLLRRLGVLTSRDTLTRAGALLFTAKSYESLDYIRRRYTGADSLKRIRQAGLSVLEELQLCLDELTRSIAVTHLHSPLRGAVPHYPEIPLMAAREAIVNGLSHRDWGRTEPTVIEHVGRTLKVTSPGGFYGGVTAENILSHPSQSRNAELTRLFAKIRLAEREGVGVDRMDRDQLAMGARPPAFRELSDPAVETTLVGGDVDTPWVLWCADMGDDRTRNDPRILLFLRHLVTEGWLDAARTATLAQETEHTSEEDCRHLLTLKIAGHPVIDEVATPMGATPAWTLSAAALKRLSDLDAQDTSVRNRFPTRAHVARSYAIGRGRISSRELASLVHASVPNVIPVLKGLASDGYVIPSSPTGKGRGFHYLPADGGDAIRPRY